MKFHFQVASMDKHDYILTWKNFRWSEFNKMMQHINFEATREPVQTVTITRWNDKNEKA